MRRWGSERGYALIVVVLIVALLAIVAVTLLDLIRVDLSTTGKWQRSLEARAVAERALLEVFDDVETAYPDSPALPTYGPVQASGSSGDYSADACWLSLAPIPGSSLDAVAGLWYQVRAIGDVGAGEARAEARVEAVRPVVVKNGTFIPRFHCR